MTSLKINGVEQTIPSEPKAFGDFLIELNNSLKTDQKVVSRILIDGKEVSEADEASFSSKSIQEFASIDFEVSSPMELAFETLGTLDQYLDRVAASIDRAAQMYKGKNIVGGDAYFAKAIDGIDLFIQTISGVKLALRFGLNTKVALAEASLVSVMNDLLEAKRQNNYVFLAELLEKDLLQNIAEWKNVVFPIFRTWKQA